MEWSSQKSNFLFVSIHFLTSPIHVTTGQCNSCPHYHFLIWKSWSLWPMNGVSFLDFLMQLKTAQMLCTISPKLGKRKVETKRTNWDHQLYVCTTGNNSSCLLITVLCSLPEIVDSLCCKRYTLNYTEMKRQAEVIYLEKKLYSALFWMN